MNRTVAIIVGIGLLVAVGAGCFFAGTAYGKSQAAASTANNRFLSANGAANGAGQGRFQGYPGGPAGAQGQARGQNGGFAGGGGTFGEITEIGDGFMTVSDNNGKQTRVEVTDTTLIEKQASVSLKDLATGETVVVSGSAGADGTITARSVQVAPAGRFGAATPAPGSN